MRADSSGGAEGLVHAGDVEPAGPAEDGRYRLQAGAEYIQLRVLRRQRIGRRLDLYAHP